MYQLKQRPLWVLDVAATAAGISAAKDANQPTAGGVNLQDMRDDDDDDAVMNRFCTFGRSRRIGDATDSGAGVGWYVFLLFFFCPLLY